MAISKIFAILSQSKALSWISTTRVWFVHLILALEAWRQTS